MRRLLLLALFLPLPVLAEEEKDSDVAVGPLVDASVTELEEEKRKAEAVGAFVEALLAQGQSEAVPVEPDATGSDSTFEPRQIAPRENEASTAGVPENPLVPGGYDDLRAQAEALRDPTEILDDVEAYVAAKPQHREARLLLGRLRLVSGDQLRSIQVLAPLMQTQHPDWRPWFWTGSAYLSMGEVELARENLDVALSKNGESADLWVQMAVLEQELGNHAGALQYLAIAERIDPDAAQTHLNKAYSLERLGRYGDALEAYQFFLVSPMNPTSIALRPTVLRRVSTIAGELDRNRG